jgi:hypothetical protein
MGSVKKKVATFFIEYEFFGRVATRDPLLYDIILLHVIFQEVLK